jgi:hypothetical protein
MQHNSPRQETLPLLFFHGVRKLGRVKMQLRQSRTLNYPPGFRRSTRFGGPGGGGGIRYRELDEEDIHLNEEDLEQEESTVWADGGAAS